MRALVFHNPNSGSANVTGDELVAGLESAGFAVTYSCKDIAKFAAGFLERPDLIVVAGGDGSVRRLLDFHAALTMPVAILPLGTANNVARSLGIQDDALALIRGLYAAEEAALDIGIVNGPWGHQLFIESIGFGVVAGMMGGRIEGPTPAATRQLVRQSVIEQVREAPAFLIRAFIDGTAVEEEVLLAEVTSLSRVGPALPLLPDGRCGDGLLDLLLLRPSEREAMIDWLHNDTGRPPIEQRTGRLVMAEWDGVPFRIDDERVIHKTRHASPVFARLISQIRVLVPR